MTQWQTGWCGQLQDATHTHLPTLLSELLLSESDGIVDSTLLVDPVGDEMPL